MSYFPLTEPGVLRKTGDSDLGQGRSLEYLVIPDSTDIMEDYQKGKGGAPTGQRWDMPLLKRPQYTETYQCVSTKSS